MIANTAFGTTACTYMEHEKPKKSVFMIYTTHTTKKLFGNIEVETKVITLCKSCLKSCIKIGQVVVEV